MSFTAELEKGVRTLIRRDRVIRDLKRQHGLPTFRPHGKYFTTLVRSILSQQISGSAAKTIIGRVSEVVGTLNDPRLLSEVPDDLLRSCGVSSQKLSYLRSLSEHVIEGKLKLRSLSRVEDEEIITALTDIKGIGVWTAKMFLLFSLGRLNVLPYEDLGVRKGAMIAYGLDEMPGKAELEALSSECGWEPYQSIASWYMWRATE
ncbi:MAG: DNA-3-methyladenine glycosylase 2 family protein [Ignavibacteriae bacterium]|nr:DNA-3-methyladenine glycosylase 2 family protein [Ignavibacteriota bacterium]MCB9216959.1 DNA-3-methyladenine glycosylase 2 family protein [Ignavibacteria bacterium]